MKLFIMRNRDCSSNTHKGGKRIGIVALYAPHVNKN